ncbi:MULTISPECIES: DUF969 domain-containing protein [Cobetia]|uniref:DUF969 domain-containing protein n=1 Tax=Cobetia crustatorum TaxID=553385 RepID=A0A558HX57_9GAMM|nr:MULTISPECIES: DUF969 domain-containing protein [Cobetia]TVU73710.1 DUF969 domain-containing protein [Cobetia crustatorum]
MLSLIGVVVIVVGLALRLNALLVVLVAGFCSGLVAGMTPTEILEALGHAFTQNRAVSLFIITLPVIGLLERNGLRDQAERLVQKFRAASAGRITLSYLVLRKLTNAFGLQLGGHPAMIRPLIAPMSVGAAERDLSSAAIASPRFHSLSQRIRVLNAVSENFGNFFSQLIFVASGGLLLIKSVLDKSDASVSLADMALYAIPTALISLLVMFVMCRRLDRNIRREQRLLREEYPDLSYEGGVKESADSGSDTHSISVRESQS